MQKLQRKGITRQEKSHHLRLHSRDSVGEADKQQQGKTDWSRLSLFTTCDGINQGKDNRRRLLVTPRQSQLHPSMPLTDCNSPVHLVSG